MLNDEVNKPIKFLSAIVHSLEMSFLSKILIISNFSLLNRSHKSKT
jgi:hypothetical protein